VWEGGAWRPRDILNMEMITCRTLLEEAARNRDQYVRNFVGLGEKAIEAGRRESPFAYVVPAGQHDRPTADRMVSILIQQGIEVHRAKSDFTVGEKRYAKGSYVVLLAQPYRANVKCLFEAQRYPDRRIYPGGPAEPPYDVAGWTLPMQMGVDYIEAGKRFDADLLRVELEDLLPPVLPPKGEWANKEAQKQSSVRFFSANDNVIFVALNSLLKLNSWPGPGVSFASIWRLKEAMQANGQTYPAGSFAIRLESTDARSTRRKKRTSSKQPSVDLSLIASRIAQPRLALYRSWMASMDEGWTRWILEQFAFDFKNVYDADVRAGNLKEKFDVIILPDQSMQQIVSGNRPNSYPEEYTGGIGEQGVAQLRAFVEAGGVLVCFDSASELAIKRFDLPVKNALDGLRRDQFYAPGSIFRAQVDTDHPVA
jgi:hypothetical protein